MPHLSATQRLFFGVQPMEFDELALVSQRPGDIMNELLSLSSFGLSIPERLVARSHLLV